MGNAHLASMPTLQHGIPMRNTATLFEYGNQQILSVTQREKPSTTKISIREHNHNGVDIITAASDYRASTNFLPLEQNQVQMGSPRN